MIANYGSTYVVPTLDLLLVESPDLRPEPIRPNPDDIVCASAAADLLGVAETVTTNQLARVAILFAQHRAKSVREALDGGAS